MVRVHSKGAGERSGQDQRTVAISDHTKRRVATPNHETPAADPSPPAPSSAVKQRRVDSETVHYARERLCVAGWPAQDCGVERGGKVAALNQSRGEARVSDKGSDLPLDRGIVSYSQQSPVHRLTVAPGWSVQGVRKKGSRKTSFSPPTGPSQAAP